jgi:hypothetical protein
MILVVARGFPFLIGYPYVDFEGLERRTSSEYTKEIWKSIIGAFPSLVELSMMGCAKHGSLPLKVLNRSSIRPETELGLAQPLVCPGLQAIEIRPDPICMEQGRTILDTRLHGDVAEPDGGEMDSDDDSYSSDLDPDERQTDIYARDTHTEPVEVPCSESQAWCKVTDGQADSTHSYTGSCE